MPYNWKKILLPLSTGLALFLLVSFVFADEIKEAYTETQIEDSVGDDLISDEDLTPRETEFTDGTEDFLILGTNGAHTDSIMIASVYAEKEQISLFSIPRDLYVEQRRINEYYTYEGLDEFYRIIEKATGIHVDHYIQIDLKGFEEVIDILGGVDVVVEKDLYDGLYPDGKKGYKAFSIKKGEHHLNGDDALKYARSRESTSDFDRAKRQQQVLDSLQKALKMKAESLEIAEMVGIFRTLVTYTKTDMSLFLIVSSYYDYKNYEVKKGLVFSTANYLQSMINENGAYMLWPLTGNFEEMKQVVADFVKGTESLPTP
jgi:LCP family protein required for cell wall assembly